MRLKKMVRVDDVNLNPSASNSEAVGQTKMVRLSEAELNTDQTPDWTPAGQAAPSETFAQRIVVRSKMVPPHGLEPRTY